MKNILLMTLAITSLVLFSCTSAQDTKNQQAQAQVQHFLKAQAFATLVMYQGQNDALPGKLTDLNDPGLQNGLATASRNYDVSLIDTKDKNFCVLAVSKNDQIYSYVINSSGKIYQWSDKTTKPTTSADDYRNLIGGKWEEAPKK